MTDSDSAITQRAARFNHQRLLERMQSDGLGALIAISPQNVQYTSGVELDVDLVPTMVLTCADGRQAVVINEADGQFFPQHSWIGDVRIYRFGPAAVPESYALLGELLREHGLERGRLGVEGGVIPWNAYESLRASVPHATVQDATDVFEHARLVKTPAEIEVLTRAASATTGAIMGGFQSDPAPRSELELVRQIQLAYLAGGASSFSHISVSAGVRSTIAHAPSTADALQTGEVVHVDSGGSFEGYVTDLARNAIVGPLRARPAEIYRHLYEIQSALIELVRPGAVAKEIFAAGQRAFAAAGLVHPWGTIGHSIGLSVHEGFELAVGSDAVLEEGMVVNVEPSHIEQGDARYHIEDSLVVTTDGARVISSPPPAALPSFSR